MLGATRTQLAEAGTAYRDVVSRVAEPQWPLPTPCAGWNVRQLLNHVVATTTKFTDFAAGLTDAPRAPEGDVLGADPAAALDAALRASDQAWAGAHLDERTCHLSFGTFTAPQAAAINAFDLLVHAWDLAAAVGARVPDVSAGLLDVANAAARRLVTDDAVRAGCYASPTGGTSAGGWAALLCRTGRRP